MFVNRPFAFLFPRHHSALSGHLVFGYLVFGVVRLLTHREGGRGGSMVLPEKKYPQWFQCGGCIHPPSGAPFHAHTSPYLIFQGPTAMSSGHFLVVAGGWAHTKQVAQTFPKI